VIDPATLQVWMSRLTGVADEMGTVLRRAAYSPNIKERADCSCALFTADGTLLVQAEHIPVHLGSMPAAVHAAIDACGTELADGEQIVVNDPFAGGTHLNDVTFVAPVHGTDGTLLGWVANRAHHADLGGMAPGSMPPDATEIYQEGLRIPPVRWTSEVEAVFLAASRTPEERRGDLDAQRGANRLGAQRWRELAPLDDVLAAIIEYGERRMRAALRALPDGEYAFEDVLDSTGGRDGARPARIVVRVTVAHDAVTFDFTGTDAQRPGSVNAVEAVTVSAVGFALRSVVDPDLPANGGALRPVRVIAPAGSIVAAQPPVAVGAGNVEVSQRVADVCLGALAQAAPERVGAASQGTMNNVLVGGEGGGEERGESFVYYETIGGGQGGRPGPRAGMNGVHTAMTNTRDTPVEAFERAYPMRVRRYELRCDSGGAGAAPGGDGIVREIEMLVDVTVSLVTERRVSQPWGVGGGAPGARGENWLLPGGNETRAERLPDKGTVHLRAGDVLRILTPGGGGWNGAWPRETTAQRPEGSGAWSRPEPHDDHERGRDGAHA
jgi:N-methylhydantoinase B/oxoprolinase/acetone carboxylase alpha subunit